MSQDRTDYELKSQFSSDLMRQGPVIRKGYMNSLVRFLKEKHGIKKLHVLEIGSWAGASTITWAKAIRDFGLTGSVHCVDIWEPYFDLKANVADIYQKMNRASQGGLIFQQFRRNISAAGVEDIVTFTKGRSADVLPQLPTDSYQIIFIDGSHIYRDVITDVVHAKQLVVDGGIVCGDDFELPVGLVDQTVHQRALADDIDFVKDPSTGVAYHPGVSQALADTFGDVSVWDGLWAIQRHGTNFEKLNQFDYEPRIPEHLQVDERATVAELILSERGFNIIRSQGRYIGCRKSLGAIDFSMALDELSQSYSSSDLIVRTSIEDVLLALRELRSKVPPASAEFAALLGPKPSTNESEAESGIQRVPETRPELIQTVGNYNIVYYRNKFIGLPLSLGPIDLTQHELEEFSYIYESREELEKKLEELYAQARPPALIGSIGSYNIVYYKNRFIGLPLSLGPIDLTQHELEEFSYVYDSREELEDRLAKIGDD